MNWRLLAFWFPILDPVFLFGQKRRVPCQAGGLSAISRWLSEATPPENENTNTNASWRDARQRHLAKSMYPTEQTNRVAVVTGSSSGIGRSIALQLAADGFDAIVHSATNESGGNDVVTQIRQNNARADQNARLVMCDFARTDALEDFVKECFAWRDRVDVWINNAGADVLTGDVSDQSFEQKLGLVLQVDVVATLILSRSVGRRMSKRFDSSDQRCRGCIINMGWDQALHGMPGDSGEIFSASKGAIMAATKSLAQSFAPAVRVNCVAPGWIRTAWADQASENWHAIAKQDSLLSRWGTPEDVAAVVSFLASDKSEFINGQIIPVNGGFRYGRLNQG